MAGWIRGDGRTFRPQAQMSRTETATLDNRDWAALEIQLAAAGDAPGGEVAPDLQNGVQ